MGKKSKKKGGTDKAARKEKLRERREQRVLETEDEFLTPQEEAGGWREHFPDDGDDDVYDDDNDEDDLHERKYFEGDRVWFWCRKTSKKDDPNTYRGIVAEPGEGLDEMLVTPLHAILVDEDHFITVRKETVSPDFWDFTLRFDVGDRVICGGGGGHPERAAVVTGLFPYMMPRPQTPGENIPLYNLRFDDNGKEGVFPDFRLLTAEMPEYNLMRVKPSDPLLRLIMFNNDASNIGDYPKVMFDPKKAIAWERSTQTILNRSSTWLSGTIIKNMYISRGGYCGAYECTFEIGAKVHTCLIREDNDEHVAHVDADPRKRLFDAIEQRCSRKHLNYLKEEFNIDVATFRDLVLAKAIEFASYHALLWLQEDCDINVLRIRDESGNNLLHMIAKSPNAIHFIRDAGYYSITASKNESGRLHLTGHDNNLLKMQNNDGEIWLQILVRRGDVKSLDVALSPQSGFAWDLLYTLGDEERQLLATSIKEAKVPLMQCIMDSSVSFQTLYDQFNMLIYSGKKLSTQQVFPGDDAYRGAKLLARFFYDWQNSSAGRIDGSNRNFTTLVGDGVFELFELLYEADHRLFPKEEETYFVYSNEDNSEFIQPELAVSRREDQDDWLDVDMFTACILGKEYPFGTDTSLGGDRDFYTRLYLSRVRNHVVFCDPDRCPSLEFHLEREKKRRDDSKAKRIGPDHFARRLHFIKDDDSCEGRQKILDYLLRKYPRVKLDVIQAIIHRQCWAIRFLVETKYLLLDSMAARDVTLRKDASTFSFLNSSRIPPTMTVKSCLCFAAVQFDDLQSLQWLCESFGTPEDLVCGWNLLHFTAYMGRVEIMAWLSSRPEWDVLVKQVCKRKPFENAYAVHIAARRGHLILCDMLVDLEVQLEDENGKYPEDYGKESEHEFVRDWAEETAKRKEAPRALEKNIKKLFSKLGARKSSPRQLKGFLLSSKCLDIDTWKKCGYKTYDVQGPLGYSFVDAVNKFCKAVDLELATWFCVRMHFYDSREIDYPEFWGSLEKESSRNLTIDELLSFATERGYEDLERHLKKEWFKDVSCKDTLSSKYDSILKLALGDEKRLVEVGAVILRVKILLEIAEESRTSFKHILIRGGKADELREVFDSFNAAVKTLKVDWGDFCNHDDDDNNFISFYLFLPIDMTYEFWDDDYCIKGHPLTKQVTYCGRWPKVHTLLAAEGYTELVRFCLSNLGGWTPELELETVRTASFLGHSAIVDIFLAPDNINTKLLSKAEDRQKAALLGAGEALRYQDLEVFVNIYGAPADPAIGRTMHWTEDKSSEGLDFDEKYERKKEHFQNKFGESLMAAVLYGYIRETFDKDVDNKTSLKTLRYLIDSLDYTHEDLMYTLELLFDEKVYDEKDYKSTFHLLKGMIAALGIEPLFHQEQIRKICERMMSGVDRKDDIVQEGLELIKCMSNFGVDIQRLGANRYCGNDEFKEGLASLEQEQLHNWAKFDIVKSGATLIRIQEVVEEPGGLSILSRDRGGLLLTHLSAAYDRVDLLEWLVVTKGMDLKAQDAEHRTVLDVAKASRASNATKWIMEWEARQTIASFLRRNHHRAMRIRRKQKTAAAATVIQRYFRAYSTRKLYSHVLMQRLEESQRFSSIWGALLESYYHKDSSQVPSSSWSDIRERLMDIKVGLDEDLLGETDEKLSRALDGAIEEEDESTDDAEMIADELNALEIEHGGSDTSSEAMKHATNSHQWLSFQMTSHVVKFLQQGDKKYRSFFVRRMQQLATGERSRILQKPLKGSKSIIFETYLEQKSGHRILWTEEEDGRIVIWYVAKHKQVSRLMQLIDDSKSRSARQHLPDSLVTELQNEDLLPQRNESKREVMLDIFGNVPLKIYDINFDSISDITRESWSPRLHLTDEERDIVEEEGTVLVLGRSGTGKTVCICNRIEHDRQLGNDPYFSQLFVARSVRLCKYVEGAVGDDNRASFLTYERLLYSIESTLPTTGQRRTFHPSQKMDFNRFKEFHGNSPLKGKVSALILWTVIRTFLKGSIEAFQSSDGRLPRDLFVEVGKLGKNRCKISLDLREVLYDEFLRYEQFLEEQQLWDDCDRVHHLLVRMKETREEDPDAFRQLQWSRVYVDEVQDYTQKEILLFFYLGGPNGLFLAGDPAQSVVEGTEFRFEEIRSVGHFVGSVLQKPKTVNVNFRSHSGILNCAGGVLEFMFKYFPSSAKQLKKDDGLFQGSRPGVLHGASVHQLNILLSDKLKGAVILTHDESASRWRRLLNDYKVSALA